MRLVLLIAAALTAASPALAQERPVEQREALLQLARVLGESHALRQACEGREDQHWRTRMTRLVETEQADPELEDQLKANFNAGLSETRRLFPACGEATRRALALAALRGRELSTALSQAKYRSGAQPAPLEEEGVTAEQNPR